jgi:hypothetical protein
MNPNQYSASEQIDPTPNANIAVWEVVIQDTGSYFDAEPDPTEPAEVRELVIKDMADRDAWGRSKYHTPLQPHNGRDALIDAYQELLDSSVYLAQYMLETEDVPTDASELCLEAYELIIPMIRAFRAAMYLRDGK